MNRRVLIIVVLILAALWVVWPDNPGIHLGPINRRIEVVRGLDLQGGLRVLLEADLPEQTEVTSEQMQAARDIVENRVNALGVTEPVVQVAGARRILVELPGVEDTEQAVATIRETALLEFVDFTGLTPLEIQTYSAQPIETDYGQAPAPEPSPTAADFRSRRLFGP